MKYEEILTRFPRPRDGLILVYLMAKSVDGEVITTHQQIAKDTDYSIKQVRSSLKNLIAQGQIEGRFRAKYGSAITICDTTCLTSQKNSKGRLRADKGHNGSDVEKRKTDFYNSLVPFLEKYPKEMIRAFFDYWSELNKSQTKMRWESEKTWETSKRLVTWANNDKQFNKNGQSTIGNRASATDKAASRDALGSLARQILEQHKP